MGDGAEGGRREADGGGRRAEGERRLRLRSGRSLGVARDDTVGRDAPSAFRLPPPALRLDADVAAQEAVLVAVEDRLGAFVGAAVSLRIVLGDVLGVAKTLDSEVDGFVDVVSF
jgi:hypothetical protein